MPTPNYSFEKRQRELAKKRKKEEKALKKAQKVSEPGAEGSDVAAPGEGTGDAQLSSPGQPASR